MMECSIAGCDEVALVQIIDWENNWEPYCNTHAISLIENYTPRDA